MVPRKENQIAGGSEIAMTKDFEAEQGGEAVSEMG